MMMRMKMMMDYDDDYGGDDDDYNDDDNDDDDDCCGAQITAPLTALAASWFRFTVVHLLLQLLPVATTLNLLTSLMITRMIKTHTHSQCFSSSNLFILSLRFQ